MCWTHPVEVNRALFDFLGEPGASCLGVISAAA